MKIRSSRLALSTAAFAVTALTLTACGSGRTDSDSTADGDAAGASIIVGTTDSLTTLDPAGSYDNGSFHVQTQVFSFLMSFEPGGATLAPDAAESCDFTSDTVYTCTLKDGLTFANGNALTAESVKFSFERQLAIADPNGPSSLLANLASVAAPDAQTVEFTLTSPNRSDPSSTRPRSRRTRSSVTTRSWRRRPPPAPTPSRASRRTRSSSSCRTPTTPVSRAR